MRSWLLPLVTQLCACQAIVGSYEVAATDAVAIDTASPDTQSPDTSVADTALPDTSVAEVSDASDSGGLVVKSCKQWYAGGTTGNGRQQLVAPGSPGYPSGVFAFCDMMGGQGATLVATRSGSTNGDVWLPGVAKKTDLPSPEENSDAVLDIDWRLLGFTDVIYELGVPTSGTPRPPGSRVNFRGLSSTFADNAKAALSDVLKPMEGKRPDCTLDTATMKYTECFAPMGVDAGISPMGSLAWVFSPNGVTCYWAHQGLPGTRDCRTSTSGAGRLYVK